MIGWNLLPSVKSVFSYPLWLTFGLSKDLIYFLYAHSDGSGETAQTRLSSLDWAVVGGLY